MDREIEDAITSATNTGTRREGWSRHEATEESQEKKRKVFVNLLLRFLDEVHDDTTVAELKQRLTDGS